jgi:spermidine synthase
MGIAMRIKNVKPLIMILFLLSGFVSLIFQVVWLKTLVLVFGNTVWAVSTLLTAFMAGLALGSWLFGKIADKVGSPLKLYGIIEGLIGFTALITLPLFDNLIYIYRPLYSLTGGDNVAMGVIKFLIAFLVLIIPTSLMGGTLPLLAKRFANDLKTAGSTIGYLYTINTLGAVLGTFISGFFLIPALGLKLTLLCASGANFIILIVILMITMKDKIRLSLKNLFKSKTSLTKNKYILWIFFLCGFAALGYEVLWNRILVLSIGSSVYAYTVMLAVYLLGIAIGAAMMSYFIPRLKKPEVALTIIQFLIAASVIFQIKRFGTLSTTITNLGNVIGITNHASYIASLFLATTQIILIPTLLFGATFPLVVKIFVNDIKKIGSETGVLYSFNTLGTILGSFTAGFLLLPVIGVQKSLVCLALLNLLIGSYVFIRSGVKKQLAIGIIISIISLFIVGYNSLCNKDEVILKAGIFQNSQRGKVEILSFSEDIYATVTVEERTEVSGTWRSLSMNGINVAGTACELFTIQKMQGHLPLLLHKNPKSVLHIGFGSGGTAWAVSRYPVEKIVIAEISRSIIEKSSKYFTSVNHNVLSDPRLDIRFTDGRNLILGTREKFDVILSDSVHPRFSGNGSLYTYDYYKLLRERLNPGGLISQWLPFYSVTPENFKMIVRAFHEVFPHTSIWYINSTVNPYVIIIGKTDSNRIDFEKMAARMRIKEVREDLEEIDIDNPFKVLDYFLFTDEKVKAFTDDVPLHTDDNMAVEYLSGKEVNRRLTVITNYYELIKHRISIEPYLINIRDKGTSEGNIRDRIQLYETGTGYNLNGQLMFLLGKREKAFKEFELIRFYNPEDLEPVEFFGASFQRPFLTQAALSVN